MLERIVVSIHRKKKHIGAHTFSFLYAGRNPGIGPSGMVLKHFAASIVNGIVEDLQRKCTFVALLRMD